MKKSYKKFLEEERQETAADSKYPLFYCTVCKMKTWVYHIHEGGKENTSKTKEKVKGQHDIVHVQNN